MERVKEQNDHMDKQEAEVKNRLEQQKKELEGME